MDSLKKIVVLQRALKLAGQMLRKYPPADLDIYDEELLRVLIGGDARDPEGEEWAKYFITRALKEYEGEE